MRSQSGDALVLTEHDERALLTIARTAVHAGLGGMPAPRMDLSDAPESLQTRCGVFVTIYVGGDLNGCIGTMEGDEPLAHAVSRLAWDAAFSDPRLPAVTMDDVDTLTVKISLLSPMEPIPCASAEELLAALRPGVDGLFIRAGGHHATFLPAVWDAVPHPRHFLDQLLIKAGLRPGRWPTGAEASRYTTHEFGDTDPPGEL